MLLLLHCPQLFLVPTTSHLLAPIAVVVVAVVAVVDRHLVLACTAGLMALVPTAVLTATTSYQATRPLQPSPTCKEAAPTVVSGFPLPLPDEVGPQLLTPLETLFLTPLYRLL